MARNLSAELISRGIRVNSVSPGPIATPLCSKLGLSAADLHVASESLLKQIPARRFGSPAEIAKAVVFWLQTNQPLLSAANFIIDGGLSL